MQVYSLSVHSVWKLVVICIFLEEKSQFCQGRRVWGDASARAAGSGSQLLI